MNLESAIITPTISMEQWLEIPETTQDIAWQQSQCFSTPSTRFQAYLNRLCLLSVLPWLEETWEITATPAPNLNALPSFWEVVNGTAIKINKTRLVLIPTQEIDIKEFRVSQEWIDIPSWAADYYLAIQVNSEDNLMRIWGYATHLQLKKQGNYNARDRTYSLDEKDLIHDLNVLWVTRQLCPDTVTKTEITPLPTLELTQANNLLERLGNPSLNFVRRAVPFTFWGALLEHGGWRQRLYEKRVGLPEQWSLVEWVKTGISDLAQQTGWNSLQFQASLGGRGLENTDEPKILFRELRIGDELYELQVRSPENTTKIWRIELHSLSPLGLIPPGVKLRLLTEDLQPFPDNERIAIEPTPKLEFELEFEPKEGLVWEIEPTPENYDREILRF